MRLLLVFLLAATAPVAAQTDPSDFAYQTSLALDGEGPIYRVPVPPFVYQAVQRDDLGDLRVLNGNGDPVPHAIDHAPRVIAVRRVTLPVFALTDTTRTTDPALSIRRDSAGTVVEILPEPNRTERSRTAYLLDARTLDGPIHRLIFTWADSTSDFVTSVSLTASDDLAQWTPWVRRATLADLEQSGQRLFLRTITPNSLTKPSFLRLTWPEGEKLPPPTRIEAEYNREVGKPMERKWLPTDLLDASPSRFTFLLNARVPADRARLRLPEMNTIAEADLRSAIAAERPWQLRSSGPIYRLRIDSAELKTPELSFDPTRAALWQLEVEPDGALGSEPPILEIGYVPETVLFVARGDGPFRLVFGHYDAESVALHHSSLSRGLQGYSSEIPPVSPARTAEQSNLAGPAALQPPTDVPVQRIALWVVLVLGVAVLGWMALRLLRQLRAEHPAA
ncbi:MAG: DUF3999 family protein [Bacteroidota bacterium]